MDDGRRQGEIRAGAMRARDWLVEPGDAAMERLLEVVQAARGCC